MNRGIRALLPLGYAALFAIVAGVGVLVAIEQVYEVSLPTGFRFERPWAGLLGLGALLVLLARGYLHRTAAPRLRISRGLDVAAMKAGFRTWLVDAPVGLRATALGLFAIALMGPQSIHVRDEAEVNGIDLCLVLDLSGSMQAADIRPNRFEAMKEVVIEFIARRPNDRIGAVVFAKEAFTLMPATTDHDALRAVVAELQLGAVDPQGTAIGNGLATGLSRLRRSRAQTKAVILLTDGNPEGGNVSPEQATELAVAMHVKVYTVLMGRSNDAPVLMGHDIFGQPIYARQNQPVNPELLQDIARRTDGQFFDATDNESLERSFHLILDQLEKSRIEDAGRVYGELYPAFAVPAIALLLIELLLSTLVLRRWP